ncbi:MAG: tetratricopeptide repeat protein [Anaeromyxobacteraceae bacterium]|nr:tetratricopeptide repeat protein [Anaeromyxobacteraceae bacterium]
MRLTSPPLIAGVALLGLAAALNLAMASRALSRPYDVLHVPAGSPARLMALGHRTTLSDLYWLATVQYVGEPRAEARGWDRLFPLVDLVTDLDPRHGYAYQTAGIVLSAAGRLEESDAILRKGIERGPNWWTFPYYLAFNAWFYRADYAEGARWAEVAARTPGASPNISHLAVSLASKSGTPEQALEMLAELRATVKDEASAARLDEQYKLALVERDAQALERLVTAFRERTGREPVDLQELVRAGLVARLPPDPFGGHYRWVASAGEVQSSANPFRFRFRGGRHRPAFKYQVPTGRPAPGPARQPAAPGATTPWRPLGELEPLRP